jgi:hypothetical protein
MELVGIDQCPVDIEDKCATFIQHALCAASEQKDQEQNRNWNSEKPEKNVASGACLFDSVH